MNQLHDWLTEQLKLAEPLDRPSTMDDPNHVAITATKKLGLLGYGSGELFARGGRVNTPAECAAVLIDCLAALPLQDDTPPAPVAEPAGEHLTVKQAADLANISERQIYRLVEDNQIKHRRVGRTIRVARSDLERYMEGSESLFD